MQSNEKGQNEKATLLVPEGEGKEQQTVKNEGKPECNADESVFIGAIYDGLGTFLFMTAIYFCKGDVTKFAFGFWAVLTLFINYSGAHVNPAITMGLYIYDGKVFGGIPKLLAYWICQFIGAYLGALVCSHFYKEAVYVGVPIDHPLKDICFSECFFTGLFLFVILAMAVSPSKPTKIQPLQTAVIVAWFYLLVNAGSTISGAAFNPAILTVLNLLATKIDPKASQFLCAMVISELVGAIIFALIYKYGFEMYQINKQNREEQKRKNNPSEGQTKDKGEL